MRGEKDHASGPNRLISLSYCGRAVNRWSKRSQGMLAKSGAPPVLIESSAMSAPGSISPTEFARSACRVNRCHAPARQTVISGDDPSPSRRRASSETFLGDLVRPRNGVEVSSVRLMLRYDEKQNGKAQRFSPPHRRQRVSALSSAFRATPVRIGRQSRAAHFPLTLLPSIPPGLLGLRRLDAAGPDPRPDCAPSRDPHGQQNAHRRLAPGRNPGRGRSR